LLLIAHRTAPPRASLDLRRYEQSVKEFSHHGIDVGSVSVNLPNMLKQKEGAVTGLTKGIEGLFAKNKVTYAKGYGKIAGPNSVHVDMMDGSKKVIETKNIIIAAGSEPIELPFLKFDEKVVVSSTGALSLTKVPKKMVLIGAGVIGLELGSVWRRLGAEVEVIEFGDRVCPGMDNEIAANFAK
jgi:dihydrolipoamide dehydrogenase